MAMYISHINQDLRKKFGLSMNEYAVIDWFFHKGELELSKNGWSSWTYEDCAKELCLAKTTVYDAVQKAVYKGFMHVDDETKMKKVDIKWLD